GGDRHRIVGPDNDPDRGCRESAQELSPQSNPDTAPSPVRCDCHRQQLGPRCLLTRAVSERLPQPAYDPGADEPWENGQPCPPPMFESEPSIEGGSGTGAGNDSNRPAVVLGDDRHAVTVGDHRPIEQP